MQNYVKKQPCMMNRTSEVTDEDFANIIQTSYILRRQIVNLAPPLIIVPHIAFVSVALTVLLMLSSSYWSKYKRVQNNQAFQD